MKFINKIIVYIGIMILLFFVLYKPNKINLDGYWEAKNIVLNGKKVYPDSLAKFISFTPNIIVSNWSKTITIPINRENIECSFQYIESNKLKLSSSKKSLNGIFNIEIIKSNIMPKSYTISVELKSNNSKTIINFEKYVIISDWNPPRHKRGTPY